MATNPDRLKTVISDPDKLIQYLKERAENHPHFKYYSNYETISKIINSRHLLLSRGDNWNDTLDREQFRDSLSGYVRFGTCLSFSISENVAMWMLYGGTQKDGAMVDLRKRDVADMSALSTFELGRLGEGGFTTLKTVSEGCALYPLDVLYIGQNDNGDGWSAKRADERVIKIDEEPKVRGLLTKSYAWSYENEVRLVLDVPEELVDDTITHAWIPLKCASDELKKRAYLAPNSTRKNSGFRKSTLQGKIDWDICRGCAYRKSEP